MAETFDPDAYLAEPEQTEEMGFDPVSYLSEQESAEAEIGPLQALGAGIAQGSTFGFADELGAAVGAGVEGLLGTEPSEEDVLAALTPEARKRAEAAGIDAAESLPEEQSLADMYEEYLALQRDTLEQAEEQQPVTTTIGNVLGGAAIPVGAAAKGATTGAKLLRGATSGAAGGAAAGAGTAEGDIGDTVEGAIEGAKLGGALGALIPGGAAAAKSIGRGAAKAGSLAREIPVVEDIIESFSRGKQGQNLVTARGRKEAADLLRDKADSYIGSVKDLQKDIGRQMNEAIEMAGDEGKTIQARDLLQNAQKEIGQFLDEAVDPTEIREARKLNKILENTLIKSGGRGELTPARVQKLKQTIQKYTPQGSSAFEGYETAGKALKVKDALEGELTGTIEEMPKLQEAYSNVKKVLSRLKVDNKNMPEEAVDKISQTLSSLEKETVSGDQASAIIDDTLKYLRNVDPALAEKYGPELRDASRRLELSSNIIRGAATMNLLGTPRALATGAANVAGLGVKNLVDADPMKLVSIADRVGKMGESGAQAARIINKSLEKDDQGRRALLFGLMQNPAYRELINGNQNELDLEDE